MLSEHRAFKRIAISFDLFLVTISYIIAYFARNSIYALYPASSVVEPLPLAPLIYYLGLLPILLLIWWGLLLYFGMYKSFYYRISDSLSIILKAAFVGFILFGSNIFMLKMQENVSRLVIGSTFILSIFLISMEKIALTYAFKVIGRKDASYKSSLIVFKRILVVGTGKRAKKFIDMIKKNPGWGIKITGLIDMDSARKGELISGYEVLGSFEDVSEVIHKNIIDEVVFIVPRLWLNKIEGIMQLCESEGIKINLAVDLFRLKFSRTKHTYIGEFPLLTFESTPDKLEHLYIKRLMDFIISAVSFLCFSFLFVLVGVIIKITSKGPVIYSQVRCGLNGRKFKIYKFRTMVVDAESKQKDLVKFNEMNGPVFKMTNDPRVTKVGRLLRKFSIDELPQLWNVLKGDMSLVGPRPPLPDEVNLFTSSQRRKMSMRPGLTCLWQVSGRSTISNFDDWMKLDLEYIDNWSLGLDLKILLKSIPVVLFAKGAL